MSSFRRRDSSYTLPIACLLVRVEFQLSFQFLQFLLQFPPRSQFPRGPLFQLSSVAFLWALLFRFAPFRLLSMETDFFFYFTGELAFCRAFSSMRRLEASGVLAVSPLSVFAPPLGFMVISASPLLFWGCVGSLRYVRLTSPGVTRLCVKFRTRQIQWLVQDVGSVGMSIFALRQALGVRHTSLVDLGGLFLEP